jgi:recombination protein RecA
VKVVKNKVAPPFTECEFDIMYNEGISRTGSVLDMGIEHKILEKKGAWIAYNGQLIGQGREAAKDYLMKNPKVLEELQKIILEKVQVVGGMTLGAGTGEVSLLAAIARAARKCGPFSLERSPTPGDTLRTSRGNH